jgi:hypothetical protein
MAFLDNSGDIILDAVLTDLGRDRLAKGDGSFKIHAYALSDDEIDYGRYNKNHSSGSAYYDLEILQTPVLEAFTNNKSLMKHKLMSYTNNNLLFLPMLLVNDGKAPDSSTYTKNDVSTFGTFDNTPAKDMFIVAVDRVTEVAFGNYQGVLYGSNPRDKRSFIMLEQGLHTDELSPRQSLRSFNRELYEDQYLIEIDNRLGVIADASGVALSPTFIDDDLIATYSVSAGANSNMVRAIAGDGDADDVDQPKIKGPRGSALMFKIISSFDLQTSNFLFTKFGETDGTDTTFPSTLAASNPISTNNLDTRADNGELLHIDTTISITGVRTGVTTDVPVRFYKCTACVER